jgi:hypothetical protein
MHCYIPRSTKFTPRKGEVCDTLGMQILGCDDCGLVTLSVMDHIVPGLYENSGMHLPKLGGILLTL